MHHNTINILRLITARHWLALIVLLISKNASACVCAPQLDFKTKDDLKSYDFIAFVKITKLSAYHIPRWSNTRVNGNIGIRINELFKGDTTSIVYDSSYDSNCALNIKEGEEWLLFGNVSNGKVSVSVCSFSRMYRDSTEKRDWRSLIIIERLNMLRHIYDHAIPQNTNAKIFYPNGKLEVSQTFKNGKLDGVRNIYYPTGQLYIAEKFKNGKRVEYRNTYMPSGQLIRQTIYRNGLIKQLITYQDTAESTWYINYQVHNNNEPLFGDKSHTPAQFSLMLDSLRKIKHWEKQIAMDKTFGDDGRSYTLKMFDYKGDTSAVGYLDWNKRLYEHTVYRNGKIEYTAKYDQLNDSQIEHDYDRPGGPKDFISKCDYCRFYFDVNSPPEATPEAIYF